MEIKEHQFIAFFEAEQAEKLCKIAILEKFASNVVIFQEGEVPDFLYLVLEGQVIFRKHSSINEYQIVAYANPNDFFGEFGILDGKPRSAQALVCQGATLAKIPRHILMDILNDTKSETVLKLFRYVIQRLRLTTEQYVKQLGYKDKMVLMGEMMNTIIHDFKSPLSGIHLSSGMIKELHPDEETEEWCNLIQEQAIRMTAMAEELLEFARGTSQFNKNSVNLSKLLQKFAKLNHIFLAQENVKLLIDCPNTLVIEGDEGKLIRVIQNLVVNAVQAYNEQGGLVEITVEEKAEGVELRIRDEGPGIPEEIHQHFFDPFVTYGKQGGTGLGTAITKSIIDGHGGSVYFKTGSKGTIFFIYLPFKSIQFYK